MEYNVLKSYDVFYFNFEISGGLDAKLESFFPWRSSRLSCAGRFGRLVVISTVNPEVFSHLCIHVFIKSSHLRSRIVWI